MWNKSKTKRRVFPQEEAVPTASVCHKVQTVRLTRACTQAGNGIAAKKGSFIPLGREGGEEGGMETIEGKKCTVAHKELWLRSQIKLKVIPVNANSCKLNH